MTTINLSTYISASIDRCFDISRDVEIHQLSTASTKERVINGRTSGLCEHGDTVTWEARHFGIRQKLTVEITRFDKPYFFEDTMVTGAFKSMRHEHHFREENGGTLMLDKFEYEVPFGLIGKVFDRLILKDYMIRFLLERNKVLKAVSEQEQ